MQWTRTASLCSPLTPTVSCATVEMPVAHHAPSHSTHVPGAPTQVPQATSHSSAHSISSRSSTAPGSAHTAPHHFVPGHLVLAHLARTRPCVFGPHSRSPVPVVAIPARAALPKSCQSTGVLEMPSITAHRLLGTPPSSPFPANTTRAHVACPRFRPHAGAIAASTRTANPACSGLAQLRCARH